jgi:hypothetical protein
MVMVTVLSNPVNANVTAVSLRPIPSPTDFDPLPDPVWAYAEYPLSPVHLPIKLE